MNDGFTIRPATQADIPTIVTHRRKMFEDMQVAKPEAIERGTEAALPWLEDRFASGYYRGWLAVNAAGEVVAGAGLMLLDWPPGPIDHTATRGYILNVYTEQAYRRRGLARRLVQRLMDWCYDNGIYTVTLHASEAGRPIYESLGFRASNEMRLVRTP